MSNMQARIAQHDFFRDMPEDYLSMLAKHASTESLSEEEVLFVHGKAANHFYLVDSGSVMLEVPAIEGPSLKLQEISEGGVLGWSWLIPPYQWHFRARATSKTELIVFDGKALRKHCDDDPAFGYELLKRFSALMSERLSFARAKMMDAWFAEGFA